MTPEQLAEIRARNQRIEGDLMQSEIDRAELLHHIDALTARLAALDLLDIGQQSRIRELEEDLAAAEARYERIMTMLDGLEDDSQLPQWIKVRIEYALHQEPSS